MQSVSQSEVRLQVSAQAYERIAAWVGNELRDDARSGVIAAALYGVIWVGANIFMLVVLTVVIARFLPSSRAVGLAPLLAVGILIAAYPIQYFSYRRTQQRVKLRSGTVVLPRGLQKPEAALTPGDTADQFINALIQLTAFPAWVASQAILHAIAPARAARADTMAMARAFLVLLESSRRVSFFDLEDALKSPRLAAALSLLVQMRGVLVWQADFPALSINDDLRANLKQLL